MGVVSRTANDERRVCKREEYDSLRERQMCELGRGTRLMRSGEE
jgi:hypothetical protein